MRSDVSERRQDAPEAGPGDARADAPEPPQPGETADLVSIGLLVFFVSVLVIVAALLVVPMLMG